MLSSKRLVQMVKKWQKLGAFGRRRVGSTKARGPSIAHRGHIFVYSSDGKRFTIPLGYLTDNLFRELFRLSQEEYGLPTDGPITLPCDASTMAYFISMYQYGASIDVERAMFMSIAADRCSVSHIPCQQQHILYGF